MAIFYVEECADTNSCGQTRISSQQWYDKVRWAELRVSILSITFVFHT